MVPRRSDLGSLMLLVMLGNMAASQAQCSDDMISAARLAALTNDAATVYDLLSSPEDARLHQCFQTGHDLHEKDKLTPTCDQELVQGCASQRVATASKSAATATTKWVYKMNKRVISPDHSFFPTVQGTRMDVKHVTMVPGCMPASSRTARMECKKGELYSVADFSDSAATLIIEGDSDFAPGELPYDSTTPCLWTHALNWRSRLCLQGSSCNLTGMFDTNSTIELNISSSATSTTPRRSTRS